MPGKSRHTTRGGAVVVEFALMLPLLAIFFGGIVEISRALLIQHTVDTAAYEGARAAIIPGASAKNGVKAATELLETTGLHGARVTVDPANITEKTGAITVVVEVPISQNIWLKPVWFNREALRSEVTLICERPPMVQLTGLPILQLKSVVGTALNGLL